MSDAGILADPPVSRQVRRAMERRERGRAATVPGGMLHRFLELARREGGDRAMRRTPAHLRAPLLVALRDCPGTPRDVWQDVLEECWVMSHGAVLQAFPDRDHLRAVFVAANFPILDDLPEHSFPVFRGSVGMTAAASAMGLSWTRSQDMACAYAIGLQRQGRPPPLLILRAEARREDVIFGSDMLGNQEVILRAAPVAWEPMEMSAADMADAADRAHDAAREYLADIAAGLRAGADAERALCLHLPNGLRGRV